MATPNIHRSKFKYVQHGQWVRSAGADFHVTRVTHVKDHVVIATSGMFTLREHEDTEIFIYDGAPGSSSR